MKKKIIDYLIDYACPIISDNRLWNFSDCTSLKQVYKQSNRKSMVLILGKFQSH